MLSADDGAAYFFEPLRYQDQYREGIEHKFSKSRITSTPAVRDRDYITNQVRTGSTVIP